MTPDEIVAEIFRIQNEADPDADPGDITIDIQDDMDMVIVTQMSFPTSQTTDPTEWEPLGMGTTIQAALEEALTKVRKANG